MFIVNRILIMVMHVVNILNVISCITSDKSVIWLLFLLSFKIAWVFVVNLNFFLLYFIYLMFIISVIILFPLIDGFACLPMLLILLVAFSSSFTLSTSLVFAVFSSLSIIRLIYHLSLRLHLCNFTFFIFNLK